MLKRLFRSKKRRLTDAERLVFDNFCYLCDRDFSDKEEVSKMSKELQESGMYDNEMVIDIENYILNGVR